MLSINGHCAREACSLPWGDSAFLLQPSPLEDSLSEVPRSNTNAGRPPLSKGPDSDSYIQVMPDNTTVIVSRGPGGSVKIHKAPPNSNGGLSNVSQGEARPRENTLAGLLLIGGQATSWRSPHPNA